MNNPKKITQWIIFLLSSLLLSACESEAPAPVIEGWQHGSGQQSDYVVQQDDTIYSVAWAYGLDYHQLVEANHLKSPYKIYPGQHLKMAAVKTQSSSISFKKQTLASSTFKKSNKPVLVKSSAPPKKLSKNSPPVLAKRNPTTNLNWCWPTKGRLAQKFSEAGSVNHGLDISGRKGQAIIAAENGKVVYAGSGLRGYGKLIIIKHDESYLSAYAYNKTLLVKEGTLVKKGQKIAEMGQNDSNQTLLHFEIRQNGKPVNPLFYLKQT